MLNIRISEDRGPHAGNIDDIGKYFNVSTAYLLGCSDDPQR